MLAIVIAPIQIAYHASTGAKPLKRNVDFERNRADQCFKYAIALIELHKLRFGDYPSSLRDKEFHEFIGTWNKSISQTLRYSKRNDGYELNLNSQKVVQLEYPLEFWNGLGIVTTNVNGFPTSPSG